MTGSPLLTCLLSLQLLVISAIAAETTGTKERPCQHDPSGTLSELEKEGAKQGVFFSDSGVPKDLRIDQKTYKYEVINPTEVHNLPSGSFPGVMNYIPPHRGTAVCRVLGSDGVWWYVERMPPNGGLVYISGRDVQLQTTDQ